MAGIDVPVVVDDVDERACVDFGGAAGGVVDVVVLEGYLVAVADEEEGPVVVAVAGGGPGGLAVEFSVGDCDGGVGVVAGY